MHNNTPRISLALAVLLLIAINPLQAKTLKIATLSPEGTFWMKQMRAGAKEIKQKTQGRVKFKFYPGGVMGSDETVLRKIRIGQLHGGAINISNLSNSIPDTTLYGLPFLFTDLDEASAIRKKTDTLLSRLIENAGFVNFGFAQGGFSYVMSKHPIHGFDDLRKQKSWVPEKSDVGLAVYQHIGITPISLPLADVLTALQTGLIDTVTMSPVGALALQWHTQVNYIVDLPLNYLTGAMIIDKRVFTKISAADQAAVREIMGEVNRNIDARNKRDNLRIRQALIKQGVKFIQLSDVEKQHWIEAGDFVIGKMIEKYTYNRELYHAVTANRVNTPKLH